jgi:Arc/MetJ family transcription regulator
VRRAAVDFALKALVGDRQRREMLDVEGLGWDGDLGAIRRTRTPEV